jgi:hypothetical protein
MPFWRLAASIHPENPGNKPGFPRTGNSGDDYNQEEQSQPFSLAGKVVQ